MAGRFNRPTAPDSMPSATETYEVAIANKWLAEPLAPNPNFQGRKRINDSDARERRSRRFSSNSEISRRRARDR